MDTSCGVKTFSIHAEEGIAEQIQGGSKQNVHLDIVDSLWNSS